MTERLHIAFFASSEVSAYWNGAATYYRGLARALHGGGHALTFYDLDAYGRTLRLGSHGRPPRASPSFGSTGAGRLPAGVRGP